MNAMVWNYFFQYDGEWAKKDDIRRETKSANTRIRHWKWVERKKSMGRMEGKKCGKKPWFGFISFHKSLMNNEGRCKE